MPVWLALVTALVAHNPDTSYARIRIFEDKVETRLTYDVFTLLKIEALNDNRDGELQRTELDSHAPRIADFLRSKIGLAVSDDDETADLGRFTGYLWPPDIGDTIPAAEFHTANGLVHFDFVRDLTEPPPVVAIAFGFFDELTDRHTVLGVFECRGDKYETSFNRIEDYFEYSTGFQSTAPQTQHTLGERLWRFFKLGVEHIFLGYDHICFLIALIVVSRFREIIKIVTSFTIAHSITLILAALDVVRLPSRLIESSIALTIVYVALENVWLLRLDSTAATPSSAVRTPRFPRWLLTFCFGLIHGFGFANVLRELGLPTTGLIRCLLSFNVGVEVGQLLIAVCLLPIPIFLSYWRHGHIARLAISFLLAFFGLAWFLARAFSLELMQRFGL
jgi:hydrogenase/urease accessory protein HupE